MVNLNRRANPDAPPFTRTFMRQHDAPYVRKRIRAQDRDARLFFIARFSSRRRGPRVVHSQLVSHQFRNVAVPGALLSPVDFLEREYRGAADLGIFLEELV